MDVRNFRQEGFKRLSDIREIFVLNPISNKFVRYFDKGDTGCEVFKLGLTEPRGEF